MRWTLILALLAALLSFAPDLSDSREDFGGGVTTQGGGCWDPDGIPRPCV